MELLGNLEAEHTYKSVPRRVPRDSTLAFYLFYILHKRTIAHLLSHAANTCNWMTDLVKSASFAKMVTYFFPNISY